MLSSQRIFVDAIRKYCLTHDIAIEVRSDGWLIMLRRGDRRHLAFAYDVGLNSATAHQIANDKAATAEVLKLSGVPCIPHTLFLGPKLAAYAPASGSWEAVLRLLDEYPAGLVVKPNEGTSGDCVFLVTTRPKLEVAATRIFSAYPSLAVSPYVEIQDEVRVVLVDDLPVAVYSKDRPAVTGDGRQSLLELALAATPAAQRSTVLSGMIVDPDPGRTRCDRAGWSPPRPELASQSRFGRAAGSARAGSGARCLRRYRDQGSKRHRHPLWFDRRCAGRRRLADPRSQCRREDGSAEPVASRIGLCGV